MKDSGNGKGGNPVRHVFIIGSKSIGQYGGYETFVDKLTEQHQNDPAIRYHIACKANGDGFMDESRLDGVTVTKRNSDGTAAEFIYHNAHVFKIPCPSIGPAVAIYYDRAAVRYSIRYCREHHIENPVFYILTCRIGLFIDGLVKQIKAIGGTYMLNPDGHEWMRAKWSAPVRRYWKWSEKKMVKAADLVICDSVNIEKYIRKEYKHPSTTFIAYGSDTEPSPLKDDAKEFQEWLKEKGLKAGEYYMCCGRFVPENSFEIMIREFMKSHSTKDFAIITTKNDRFLEELDRKLGFSGDKRIRFVGTVYNRDLLKKIRENAYANFHGHTVGGTNPSLLEALGSTDVNLLIDVGFNREVAEDTALYWQPAEGSLASLIDAADRMSPEERADMGEAARARIKSFYSWKYIADLYRQVWMRL